jgi:hypothetical protein
MLPVVLPVALLLLFLFPLLLLLLRLSPQGSSRHH